MPDLACSDQLGHRTDGLLDRDRVVDAMLVIKVDVVDAEALQRRVARLADVFRRTRDPEKAAFGRSHVSELRREHHLVTPTLDCAPDELLVGERTVHVGRVEEDHAEIQRAMDGRDRLLVVVSRVELGHPHAAEAEG